MGRKRKSDKRKLLHRHRAKLAVPALLGLLVAIVALFILMSPSGTAKVGSACRSRPPAATTAG